MTASDEQIFQAYKDGFLAALASHEEIMTSLQEALFSCSLNVSEMRKKVEAMDPYDPDTWSWPEGSDG